MRSLQKLADLAAEKRRLQSAYKGVSEELREHKKKEKTPIWMARRVVELYHFMGVSEFTSQQADNVLNMGHQDPKAIYVFLSRLKDHGFVESWPDPEDGRSHIYKLALPHGSTTVRTSYRCRYKE
jgi:hypothetical protein